MKYEWRKKDKAVYLPKTEPTIVQLPSMNYVTISGSGTPGDETFSSCVGALYAISYAIRMAPKAGIELPGYYEYTVFPLEGFWDLNEEGLYLYEQGTSVSDLKGYMEYKLMIRQPDFVTREIVEDAVERSFNKKKDPKIKDIVYETIDEGMVCQMMHIGSYADEPASFERMEKYCMEQGFKRREKIHKEIYVSDPSRVSVEKLKTTIRFAVE